MVRRNARVYCLRDFAHVVLQPPNIPTELRGWEEMSTKVVLLACFRNCNTVFALSFPFA